MGWFTNFAQLLVSGVALGCLYALVALSFVIVVRATGVFNIVQGSFVLFGAYLVFQFHVTWGMPFWVAVIVTLLVCSASGVVLDRFIFRRAGRGVSHSRFFAVLLVGIGILTVGESLVEPIWGDQPLNMNDPFGLRSFHLGGVSLTLRDVSVIGVTVVLLLLFWYMLQKSRVGIAMRAIASDPEAARVQGVNPGLVSALAWVCAACAGAVAGIMLGTAVGGGINPTLDQVAFLALPALILGGSGSIAGSLVGGVFIGAVQSLAAGYAPVSFGSGFGQVVPWVVMIVILLIRPAGFFGPREVRRA